MRKTNVVRGAGAMAGLAALALVATPTGGAAAGGPAKGDTALVEIKINNNGRPTFLGPETVNQGGTISIVNHTNPGDIGPHTFSLVKKSALPQGEAELKECGHFGDVCKIIRKAHGIPRHDFVSETPEIEKGEAGWDKSFNGGRAKGDSQYFPNEDDEAYRPVSAEPGKLWYLCAIHARMQGSINVVPGGR